MTWTRSLLLLLLGLVLAGGTWRLLLAPRRSARFARAVPILPTDLRVVLLARSADGESWQLDPTVVARPADTPDLVEHDGRTLLFTMHGSLDLLVVQDLDSGRREKLDLGACGDAAGFACVDPAAVLEEDGGLRLFFAQAPLGVDPALSPRTRIRSATSSDGWSWRLDPDPVLDDHGRVDPDPVRLPDGRLRLYTTHLGDRGLVVESAVSGPDGRFRPEPGVRLREASATRTAAVEGGYRTWFHDHDDRLRVAESADGLSFRTSPRVLLDREIPGTRFLGVEAPGVLRTDDGWLMALSTAREPWWPVNERVASEALGEAGGAP